MVNNKANLKIKPIVLLLITLLLLNIMDIIFEYIPKPHFLHHLKILILIILAILLSMTLYHDYTMAKARRLIKKAQRLIDIGKIRKMNEIEFGGLVGSFSDRQLVYCAQRLPSESDTAKLPPLYDEMLKRNLCGSQERDKLKLDFITKDEGIAALQSNASFTRQFVLFNTSHGMATNKSILIKINDITSITKRKSKIDFITPLCFYFDYTESEQAKYITFVPIHPEDLTAVIEELGLKAEINARRSFFRA